MKSRTDLVRGWIRKAESDLDNVKMCLASSAALDTACFHAQQSAEKYLKAYMTAHDIEYPFVHNLEKLISLCAAHDPGFVAIQSLGADLTPYAVELRYDDEFWPDIATVRRAHDGALAIKEFVVKRLPAEVTGNLG